MPQLRCCRRQTLALMALMLLGATGVGLVPSVAHAEKYQSRLNSLLLKKNDVYLPTRLVLGQEARFVVRAQAGSVVKVLLSAKNEGYVLPNGTPLRVGSEVQELSGTVPENGVLELKMAVPKEAELEGQTIYVDAASGATAEELAPMELMDSSGRRTDDNTLTMVKPTTSTGANVLPSMPGLSPQMLNQITNMSNAYAGGDERKKQLLDNGAINRDRASDQNPFVYRGMQPGLGGTK